MGDTDSNEKYAGISALEGGFVVTVGNRQIVVTSLNKAIKLVREFLTVDGSTSEGE